VNQSGSIPFQRTRFDRLLAIVMVFALTGPPFGLITLIASAPFRPGSSLSAVTPAGLWRMLVESVSAIPFAYLLGVVPAAAAGLLIGICKEWMGRAPWWMALIVGIIVGVGFIWFMEQRPPSSRAPAAAVDSGLRVMMLLANVVPTMLCWWIVQNWFPTPRTTS
jgi:hypothetical protein